MGGVNSLSDIKLSEFSKVFVIAEIGNNHNGSIDLAKRMILEAVASGADAVKFQIRDNSKIYRKLGQNDAHDLGTEYVLDLLHKVELSRDEHCELKIFCDQNKILYFCTPWDEGSLEFLTDMDVQLFKIASADFTNIEFIKKVCKTGKSIILSTGMTTEVEINTVTEILKNNATEFALLHCNSSYPAAFDDINLNYMNKLMERHNIVGYSGHERGISVSIAAVALGAKIIERHFTFDRSMEGPDHLASLEPEEFKKMVEGIREVEKALGNNKKRSLTQGELINRENLGKSVVASRSIKKGEVFVANDFEIRSPGQGLSPLRLNELIGLSACRDIEFHHFLYESDIVGSKVECRKYNLLNTHGIPVRYHDYSYFSKLDIPLLEFHLSYSDLKKDPHKYLVETDKQFVIHAPELFADSELLDIMSPDFAYRQKSIDNLNKVFEISRTIAKYSTTTENVSIVANLGGFSEDQFLDESGVSLRRELFSDSLKKLELDGVELLPQNMAPFPWHFGGQRYQNVFLYPSQIVELCQQNNLKLCLDLSHGALYCHEFNIDFTQYVAQLLPFTSHMHVGDAAGNNGEGIQLGDGDIDLLDIGKQLKKFPSITVLPEIWQGHKNFGEGFWVAFERMEKLGW